MNRSSFLQWVRMTTVSFGEIAGELTREALDTLDGHETLWKDDFPSRWEEVPLDFRRALSRSVGLKVLGFTRVRDGVAFEAEWDDIQSNIFREEEFWIGTTSRAGVRIRNIKGASWLFMVVGPSDGFRVATRVSKALFGVQGRIFPFEIPTTILKTILGEDSRGEKFMWWEGVETGVDGALRGSLPRAGGARERFDQAGHPYFARFESTSLGKQLSISCKRGSVGGRMLKESEAVRYFLERVLPRMPRTAKTLS